MTRGLVSHPRFLHFCIKHRYCKHRVNIMKLNTILRASIIVAAGLASQAEAQIIYGSYNGSELGITIRDSELNQSTAIVTGFSPNAIAAGPANTFYVASENNIHRFNAKGNTLKKFTFPDAGVNYTGLAYAKNQVYASFNGSQQGVSIRGFNTLTQTSNFATPFSPNAIAVGPNNTLYMVSGNHLYKYTTAGTELIDEEFTADPGVNYTGITVNGNRVYASYDGSQTGVSVRDLNLVQLSFFVTPFSPTGIDAGINNDLYLSTSEHLYRYSTSGKKLVDISFPSINYTGIASEQ